MTAPNSPLLAEYLSVLLSRGPGLALRLLTRGNVYFAVPDVGLVNDTVPVFLAPDPQFYSPIV